MAYKKRNVGDEFDVGPRKVRIEEVGGSIRRTLLHKNGKCGPLQIYTVTVDGARETEGMLECKNPDCGGMSSWCSYLTVILFGCAALVNSRALYFFVFFLEK